jgi:hypothetical protein
MAEKIYVLDTHTRIDPSLAAKPSRRDANSRASARDNKAPARSAPPPRQDEAMSRHGAPAHDDGGGVLPMGAYGTRPDWSRVAPLVEEMPEPWVKTQSLPTRRPFRALGTLLGLYSLGGVAPLALRVGPRQFGWATLWIVSLTGWVTLGWFWKPVHAMMTSARLPILPFLLALVIVHVMGSLSWSRAVVRTVRDDRFQPDRLPGFLRHPGVAGPLGMVFPGIGLAMAGHGRRAGLALWNAAQVLFAGLLLFNSGLLWTWNTKEGVDALPKTFVEGILAACVGVVVLGGLLWIGSALDGARFQERIRATRRLAPGDGVALALMLALATFAVSFRPARVAHDLDAFATSMRFSGYRLIPLALESSAATLDPGRPEYAMRVAELHTDMGHTAKAQIIHARLRERWEAYAQMLLQSASTPSSPTAASLKPIQPAGDLVPRTPELAPTLEAGMVTRVPIPAP